MTQALDELVVAGVATNQAFHRRLHGRPGVPARARSTSSSWSGAPISSPGQRRPRPDARSRRGRGAGGGPGPPCPASRPQRRKPASSSEWARQARREGAALSALDTAKGSGDRGSNPSPGRRRRWGRQAARREDGVRATHRAGDLVELAELRDHKRFARARPGRLLEASPDRVEPRCPHYVDDDCGGCQLQHSELRGPARSPGAPSWATPSGGWASGTSLIRRSCPPHKIFDYRTKLTLHVSEDQTPDRASSLRKAGPGVRPGVVPHHRARADGAVAGDASAPSLPAAPAGTDRSAARPQRRPACGAPGGGRRGLGRLRAAPP